MTESVTEKEIDEALAALRVEIGEETAVAIRPTLMINRQKGRINSFLQNPDTRTLSRYIQRVAHFYSKFQPLLYQLQIEKSAESWQQLRQRLHRTAYHYLCRKNFRPDQNTSQIALDCATDALIRMTHAHFPYDTDFYAWANVFIINLCRKRIEQLYKQRHELDTPQLDMDYLLKAIVDPNSSDHVIRHELRQAIEQAIEQLTEARQTVIKLKYFQHKTNNEIATTLNKSTNAIYKLHFDALAQLRKILGSNEDNYE